MTAFAKKCGIKQPIVDRYFNRGYEPKLEQLTMICRAHGCSLDWLAGISDIKEPNVTASESEWQVRAVAAERKLRMYDYCIESIMRGHEEMLKGIQGISKINRESTKLF